MGMVAIGMMDLMALPCLDLAELGEARQVFCLGQRFGRICNVLVTAERERREGDVTSEIAIGERFQLPMALRLQHEADSILGVLRERGDGLASFSIPRYAASLDALHALHERLRGVL
jgi:hypothetical protein